MAAQLISHRSDLAFGFNPNRRRKLANELGSNSDGDDSLSRGEFYDVTLKLLGKKAGVDGSIDAVIELRAGPDADSAIIGGINLTDSDDRRGLAKLVEAYIREAPDSAFANQMSGLRDAIEAGGGAGGAGSGSGSGGTGGGTSGGTY